MADDSSELPPPPPALLDLLRRAEARLDTVHESVDATREELEAARREIRALRNVLETRPTVEAVAGLQLAGEGHLELGARGSATGQVHWQGEAHGQAGLLAEAPVREWLDKVKRHGPKGAKAAGVVAAVVNIADKVIGWF